MTEERNYIPSDLLRCPVFQKEPMKEVFNTLFKLHNRVQERRHRTGKGWVRCMTHSRWRRDVCSELESLGKLYERIPTTEVQRYEAMQVLSCVLAHFNNSLERKWIAWAITIISATCPAPPETPV